MLRIHFQQWCIGACAWCRLLTIWVSSIALSSSERAEALATIVACMASAAECQRQPASPAASISFQAAGLAMLYIGAQILMTSSSSALPPWLLDLLHPVLEVWNACPHALVHAYKF